jgi:hypothetical protein
MKSSTVVLTSLDICANVVNWLCTCQLIGMWFDQPFIYGVLQPTKVLSLVLFLLSILDLTTFVDDNLMVKSNETIEELIAYEEENPFE